MVDRRLVVAFVAVAILATALFVPIAAQSPPAGIREAAWAPDGKRVAVSRFDVIWTMAPDGKSAKRVVARPGEWIAERDPAWSPDGKSIAFSASTAGQFDIWIAPAAGGAGAAQTLPVDWEAITREGDTTTNYQILPGDRIFIAPKQPDDTESFSFHTGRQRY